MANHKSALKRIRSNETKRSLNKLQHKTTRNAIKKLKEAKTVDGLVFAYDGELTIGTAIMDIILDKLNKINPHKNIKKMLGC